MFTHSPPTVRVASLTVRVLMSRLCNWIGLIALGCSLAGAGCKDKSEDRGSAATALAASTATGSSTGATPAPAPSGDAIGVADCDAYVAKVQACFARDPETKAAREATFRRLTTGWRRSLAANRAAVELSCKLAYKDLDVTMPACK